MSRLLWAICSRFNVDVNIHRGHNGQSMRVPEQARQPLSLPDMTPLARDASAMPTAT